jgi:chemotaxis protein histidine kinase CheA/AmiR/NasT family two-component response regulator
MKIGNTALVIDDNRVALMLSSKMVQAAAKDFKIITFSSAKAAIEYLEKTDELPSVIFSDLNMDEMNGLEFLAWCKRHPKIHQLPFIVLTAESQIEDLGPQGAVDFCLKPLQPQAIESAMDKAKQKFMCFSNDTSLDAAFIDETFELTDRMKNILEGQLQEKEINEIYRIFHTIKGVSASLDYNYLAQFIHKAENFLTTVKTKKKYEHPGVKLLLLDVHSYLVLTLESLKNNQVMPLVTPELSHKIIQADEYLQSAWLADDKIQVSKDTSTNVHSDAQHTKQTKTDVVSKSDTLRVKHKELDEIQSQLKKIIQIKVQLNHFGRQLNEEFYDESFPKDLIQMVNKLESAGLMALESLIMLRVQPLDLLHPYADKIVNELTQKLNKKCQITFNKGNFVEVDTPIIELLKATFTHILRNALDHGIESPDERIASGKTDTGQIDVYYEKLENKTFKVEIKDNGRGIIQSKLKKVLIEKNILSEEQVSALNEHQINQMIFVDGLSTKDAVSDISGRGVGISAVKDDIEKIGGSLVVESKEGAGTKFTITLPLYFVL